jgi:tetratricopeptide (TPR) repeat protein
VWAYLPEGAARQEARAEAAAREGDWNSAREQWHALNRTERASLRTLLGEARACLATDRAAQAEHALVRASVVDPSDPSPWLLRLGILHAENRIIEANQVGWAAYASVAPRARREVLQALTLALLTESPDDLARDQLTRWVTADPSDADAQVALLVRVAAQPRSDDLDRAARIAALRAVLGRQPYNLGAREALVNALSIVADLDAGRSVLEEWPADARDARYYRLRGRWDLDYEHQPARAAEAFQRALDELPHDWKTHYGLAKALNALGKTTEAHREAETVSRLREALSPEALSRRLTADFAHLEQPQSCYDLADLCTRAGLDRLADAWRLVAIDPGPGSENPLGRDFHTPRSLQSPLK